MSHDEAKVEAMAKKLMAAWDDAADRHEPVFTAMARHVLELLEQQERDTRQWKDIAKADAEKVSALARKTRIADALEAITAASVCDYMAAHRPGGDGSVTDRIIASVRALCAEAADKEPTP